MLRHSSPRRRSGSARSNDARELLARAIVAAACAGAAPAMKGARPASRISACLFASDIGGLRVRMGATGSKGATVAALRLGMKWGLFGATGVALDWSSDDRFRAGAGLRWRLRLLPPLDRALATHHRRARGVRALPGGRGAIPRAAARAAQIGGASLRALPARVGGGGGGPAPP